MTNRGNLKSAVVSRPQRLAFVSSYSPSIINFRGPLIREFVQRGVEVYVFAPDYDSECREGIRALGAVPLDYSLARAGMNPIRDFADSIRLAIRLRSLNLDMVFSYFIKPVIYGTLAASFAGIPKRYAMIEGAGYVFTDSESTTSRRRLLRKAVIWLYRVALSRAKDVFMLNPDDKELFVSEGMVDADKVRLLNGIGLELDHYTPAPISTDGVCFLLIGRLLKEKGIYDYVEAARKLKMRHSNLRFVLLGSVDLNPGSISETEVRHWVAEGLIEWPGQVADVRSWITAANVFVLPSYREGLPRSTQEAMAMGRPVITTDVPGCRETVENGVNGYIVPVRDSDALADAMEKFILHPETMVDMGRASRRIAEEKFDVHKINAEIVTTMQVRL